MAIHINDFLCNSDEFIQSIISKLQDNFVGKMVTKCCKYLGLNIIQEGNIITLDQKNDADNSTKNKTLIGERTQLYF